jgi:hypothetical protein
VKRHHWLQINGPGTPLIRVAFEALEFHGGILFIGGQLRRSTRYWLRRAQWNRRIKARQRRRAIHVPMNLTPLAAPFPWRVELREGAA